MNELTVIQETMSSKEIAEMLDKRHDTVKVSMERLRDQEVISFTSMTEMIEVGKGAQREMTVYHVNERDSYIVVAQLSPVFTAQLVDHWRELRGENMELKALVAAQGKKIDMLCDKLLASTTATQFITDAPAQPKQMVTRYTRKHIYNYNVIEVKALHNKGMDIPEIAFNTGYSLLTVQRIIRGERDHLIKS